MTRKRIVESCAVSKVMEREVGLGTNVDTGHRKGGICWQYLRAPDISIVGRGNTQVNQSIFPDSEMMIQHHNIQ